MLSLFCNCFAKAVYAVARCSWAVPASTIPEVCRGIENYFRDRWLLVRRWPNHRWFGTRKQTHSLPLHYLEIYC